MRCTFRRGVVGITVASVVAAGGLGWAGGAAPRLSPPCGAGRVAFWRASGSVDVVSLRDGAMTTLTQASSLTPVGGVQHTDPSWSPDGKRVTVGRAQWAPGLPSVTSDLLVANADGTGASTLLSLALVGAITEVDWSPDGRRIAFTLYTANFVVGAATWSNIGSRSTVWVVNADGSGLRPVGAVNVSFDHAPEWAPDSRRLAWLSNQRGLTGVHVADIDAAEPVASRVTPLDMTVSTVHWSPDGRNLAFLGSQFMGSQPADFFMYGGDLWISAADGTALRRFPVVAHGFVSWAPHGREVAVTPLQRDRSDGGVAAVDVATARVRSLAGGPASAAGWSPDGKWVAFLATHEGRVGRVIVVARADGRGGRRELTGYYDSYPGRPRWCR